MESHLIERLRNEETMRYAKIMDEAADRIEQLEAELKTERRLSFRSQVAELEAERDKLKIALNFARQGYQSRFENGDAGDVEWAEMYIQSIDAALAKGEIND